MRLIKLKKWEYKIYSIKKWDWLNYIIITIIKPIFNYDFFIKYELHFNHIKVMKIIYEYH